MPATPTQSGLRQADVANGGAGADDGVSSSQGLLGQTRDLLRISRPRFWLYLGGTYLVGYAFGAPVAAALATPVFAVHLLYFLVPANVFLYGINDLFDEDTDQLNPKKGQQEHRLQRGDRRTVRVAVALCAALGLVLTAVATSWADRFFFAAFLALGAAYSAPPARLKARPILDFSSNVLYAMPGFLGYAQASGSLPPGPAFLGAAAWTGAMHLFSAIPDIAADRSAGLSTTATVLGGRPSLALCTALWLTAALCAMDLASWHPASLAALVYPAISAALMLRYEAGDEPAADGEPQPERDALVDRVYWLFPWLNAAAGFALFLVAASRWIG